MTAAFVILALLVALFFLVWGATGRRRAGAGDTGYLNTQQSEVDIEVLGLLLSQKENEFLRRSLPAEEFRRIRRQRLSLARTYLKAINRTTGDFISAAEAVKSSGDREVAQAAHELLLIAFRVRLNLPVVQMCLLAEWLFPQLSLVAAPKLAAYKEMVQKIVFVFNRLPSSPAAIESRG